MMVLIAPSCGDAESSSPHVPPVFGCSAVQAIVARFNSLSADAQEKDLRIHQALTRLPPPVEVQIDNSFLLERDEASGVSAESEGSLIMLTGGTCQVTVRAKSPRVEAQIRAE